VTLLQGAGWTSVSVLTDTENLAQTGVRKLDRLASNESRSTDYGILTAYSVRYST